MGYKTVCLDCRKVLNHGSDFEKFYVGKCPNCEKLMVEVDQKFQAPKSTDTKHWEIVKYLIHHGFKYQRIYEIKFQSPYVKYPENMRDAKEFVLKYIDQAIK